MKGAGLVVALQACAGQGHVLVVAMPGREEGANLYAAVIVVAYGGNFSVGGGGDVHKYAMPLLPVVAFVSCGTTIRFGITYEPVAGVGTPVAVVNVVVAAAAGAVPVLYKYQRMIITTKAMMYFVRFMLCGLLVIRIVPWYWRNSFRNRAHKYISVV